METTKVVDFLKDLAGSWGVEINKNANSLTTLSQALWQSQIYFCAWFEKWLTTRCKDWDFKKKKYIPVDIDIRLDHYERTKEVLSHDEMIKIINWLLEKIDNTTEFSTYSYAVCSGNWLHLYYVWDEIEIDYNTYAQWVEYMQWMLNDIIAPYKCDNAVKNISRIMRLPWTVNPRKKQHGGETLWDLWNYECEFLKYRPWTYSQIVWSLPILAEEYNKMHAEVKKIISNYKVESDWEDFKSIDVWELAQIAWWITIWRENWDIITLKETHKNMGAYIYKPYNIVVNTWSSLIREKSKKTFTPFDIVCYEMMGGDKKKTLEYFKEHYHVEPKKTFRNKNDIKEIEIPELNYDETKWFLYPAPVFDDVFRCFMAWELVTICAEPNSWKTTFALDILTRNKNEKNRKWFYINLEFNIRNVWRQRWLYTHWFDKLNLTDLAPLSADDRAKMDMFVDRELAKFDYVNEPTGLDLNEVAEILIDKAKEWYELVVIDTLWDIHWNSWDNSWSTQNNTMQVLQSIAQKTWIAIILLHHMNKNWKYSGSAKIKDYSNVFIEVSTEVDADMETYTEYQMTKDKFLGNDKVVDCYYDWWAYRKF